MYRVWKHLSHVDGLSQDVRFAAIKRFLANQLVLSAVVLALFPAWLFVDGRVSTAMVIVLAGLLTTLAAVVMLKTGASVFAFFVVSSTAFAIQLGVLVDIAGVHGVLLSVWFLIIPFEALLSRDYKAIASAVGLTVAAYFWILIDPSFRLHLPHVFELPQTMAFLCGPVLLTAYLATIALVDKKKLLEREASISQVADDYRFMVKNINELITRHNPQGDVVFASCSSNTVLGIHWDDVLGQGLFERIHVADRPAYLHMFQEACKTYNGVNREFRVRKQEAITNERGLELDHTFAWMEMTCRPILDEAQHVAELIVVTRNVSERKIQQEALQNAHETLQKNSDAKSQFLANMSHELRTPLNAIIGFSEILEQDLFGKLGNDKHYEYVRLVRESGSHLLQVVTDVLDMSKIDSGTFDITPEPFDVANLVNSSAKMLSQQASSRGIELKVIVPPNLPEAIADPRACRQVLINLISNAIKFSDEDSSITLGARLEGHNIAYFVRDSGIGMNDEDLERIGQPFFQADSALDRKYEGTGLGVSVVKGLIELHGGSLTYESKIGRGTTATARIPVNCDDTSKNIERFEALKEKLEIEDHDEPEEFAKRAVI